MVIVLHTGTGCAHYITVSPNHKLYNTNKTKNYLTNNAVFRERFMEIHIQKICALVISIKILM